MLSEVTKPHYLGQTDHKIAHTGAGEMAKWIRAWAALTGDQQRSNTHHPPHDSSQSPLTPVPGDLMLSGLRGHPTCT